MKKLNIKGKKFKIIPEAKLVSGKDERDEWDEKRGIEVCASKLDMKNHHRLAKQYSRIYRLLMETANTVYMLCKLHLDKADAIEKDLVRHYGRMEV